jgi:hypothetical protein
MPTTPLAGIPYPALTDANNPPQDMQNLADWIDPLVKPQIQTYTPTWSQSDATTLSLGTGTLTGKYIQVGRLVQFRILLVRGSTTNFGSSVYYWSLPVVAETLQQPVGNGLASVAGGAIKGLTLRLANTTTVAAIRPDDSNLAYNTFAWATGDWIALAGSYIAGA